MDGWMSAQIWHKLSSCPGLFNPLPTQTHPCWDNTEGTFFKNENAQLFFLVWYDEMKQREAPGRVYMIVFMCVCAVL